MDFNRKDAIARAFDPDLVDVALAQEILASVNSGNTKGDGVSKQVNSVKQIIDDVHSGFCCGVKVKKGQKCTTCRDVM